MSIAVITAAVPERIDLLGEALESVRTQTLQPAEHVIVVDYDKRDTADALNRALEAVTSEWVAVLDDDDVLYPHHLETLAGAARFADVVYSNFDCDWGLSCFRAFDPKALREENFIPTTALIRTSKLRDVGGWPAQRLQDWGLWLRILDAQGRFVAVPRVTWRYRRHVGRSFKSNGTL